MCKPGDRVGLGIALMLVASMASAESNCDGTRVGELTRSTLAVAEVCLVTVQQAGKAVGGQSVECQTTRIESQRQYDAVRAMAAQGCTTYYNGPSKADVRRLGELGDLFSTAR